MTQNNESKQYHITTPDFKQQILDLYFSGRRKNDILYEYDIDNSLLDMWISQAINTGSIIKLDDRSPESELLVFEPWKRYVLQNEATLRTADIHNQTEVINIGEVKVHIYSGNNQLCAGMWLQSEECNLRIYSRLKDDEKIIWRSFEGECEEGPLHQHDEIEIGYVVEGNAYQTFSGKEYQFNQGDFWIVDRNCYHCDIYKPESLFTVFIGIPSEVFDSVMENNVGNNEIQQFLYDALLQQKKSRQFLHFKPRENKSNGPVLMELLLSEIIYQRVGYYDMVKGLLARLIECLSTEYEFLLTSQEQQKIKDILFKEVERFTRDNYKTLNLTEMVKHFHYNEDYYNRLFKEYSGYTFSEYLKEIRLKEAEKKLLRSDTPIEQIVEQVGYQSKGHFYRLFTERYGMTPAKYRKQYSRPFI